MTASITMGTMRPHTTTQVATSPREGALVVSCIATFMMRWLIPRV